MKKRNNNEVTFQCHYCDKDYLCLDHLVKEEKCCEECEKAREQEREEARKRAEEKRAAEAAEAERRRRQREASAERPRKELAISDLEDDSASDLIKKWKPAAFVTGGILLALMIVLLAGWDTGETEVLSASETAAEVAREQAAREKAETDRKAAAEADRKAEQAARDKAARDKAEEDRKKAAADADSQKTENTTARGEMILIPWGTFNMGSADGDSDEMPVTRVTLSPYYIDRLPVTVEDYQRCVSEGPCTAPRTGNNYNWGVSGKEKHPVNGVTWYQARQYCRWRGGDLATEAQWEFAARGTDGRKYPWGPEDPDNRRACWNRWASRAGTCEVGSHPAGASPFGVLDMSGNVWEWVSDRYDDKYPGGSVTNPTGPEEGTFRVLRGGSWLNDDAGGLRAAYRSRFQPAGWSGSVGFRCARGAGF